MINYTFLKRSFMYAKIFAKLSTNKFEFKETANVKILFKSICARI